MSIRAYFDYLWVRRGALLWYILCALFFGLFCYLYRLPIAAIVYAMVLCGAVGLLGSAAGFIRCQSRAKTLAQLKGCITPDPSMLPQPVGAVQREYDALLRQSMDEAARLSEESQAQLRQQLEAYSLWTHQIKVPISAMRLLLTDSVSRRDATLLAELFKVEQYADMALNYARLHAASTDYVIREYALDDILRQLLRRFAPLFSQKKLSLCYEPVALMVLTDEKWLLFALEQILSNAVKYTQADSVTLSVDTQRETLSIQDTGIGIASEDIPRVFDQGYTGYNGRSDKRATGLGLYLCRQTLNRLGHSISLVSEAGKGTTVTIGLGRPQDSIHE